MNEISSDSSEAETDNNYDVFLELFCRYPIIFEKSQVPNIKQRKTEAFKVIHEEIFKRTAKKVSITCLQKKFQI